MKRKLSIFLLIAMMLSALSLFSVSAEDSVVKYSHNMNGVSDSVGGTLFTTSSSSFTGSSMQVKVTKTSSNTRRSKLLSFTNGDGSKDGIIPIGTYEISIWVRYTTNKSDLMNTWSTSSSSVNSEVLLAFYGIGESETSVETQQYDEKNCLSVTKLLYLDNATNTFVKDESSATVVGEKTWYRYSVEVAFDEPCRSAAVWIVNNAGAESFAQDQFMYIDDLEITQTAPTEHTDAITFRGVQNSAIDSTDAENPVFNTRLVSTLDNASNYVAAGYDVTVQIGEDTKSKTLYLTEVYESLIGHKDTTGETDTLVYKREYYNAGAIGAMTIQNLPANTTVILTVTPFTIAEGNTPVPATAYTVTYENGVVTNIAKA